MSALLCFVHTLRGVLRICPYYLCVVMGYTYYIDSKLKAHIIRSVGASPASWLAIRRSGYEHRRL